ncbi:MAG: hypothetical protein ACR2QF_15440 [Geminicoccaceae bacterium]
MMTGRRFIHSRLVFLLTAALGAFAIVTPAESFCVRNDTGASIVIEAVEGSANFSRTLVNNKKACCQPKDAACAIGEDKVKLTISSQEGAATCQVTVPAKGNVNVTGRLNKIKCKANKAGSTMDWVSG